MTDSQVLIGDDGELLTPVANYLCPANIDAIKYEAFYRNPDNVKWFMEPHDHLVSELRKSQRTMIKSLVIFVIVLTVLSIPFMFVTADSSMAPREASSNSTVLVIRNMEASTATVMGYVVFAVLLYCIFWSSLSGDRKIAAWRGKGAVFIAGTIVSCKPYTGSPRTSELGTDEIQYSFVNPAGQVITQMFKYPRAQYTDKLAELGMPVVVLYLNKTQYLVL